MISRISVSSMVPNFCAFQQIQQPYKGIMCFLLSAFLFNQNPLLIKYLCNISTAQQTLLIAM